MGSNLNCCNSDSRPVLVERPLQGLSILKQIRKRELAGDSGEVENELSEEVVQLDQEDAVEQIVFEVETSEVGQIEEKPVLFEIPVNLVNACEKYYKFDLTPLGIKKIINEKIGMVGTKGL